MTEEKKKEVREKNRNYKAKKRLGMTVLEKNLLKEKDRLRKKKEREEKKLEKEKDRLRKKKEREDKKLKKEKEKDLAKEKDLVKEKDQVKEKEKLRKKKEREDKKLEKEKDLRKRRKEGEFKHRGEYNQAKDKRYTTGGSWKREMETNPSFRAQYNAFAKRKERKKRKAEKAASDKKKVEISHPLEMTKEKAKDDVEEIRHVN